MKQCPKCSMMMVSAGAESCPKCGTQLELAKTSQRDDEYLIPVNLEFTIYVCDECGAANRYGRVECSGCGADLTNDDGKRPSRIPDPIVEARREALRGLVKMRDRMRKELDEPPVDSAISSSATSEEAYRRRYLDFSERFLEQTTNLRNLFSSIEFTEKALRTRDLHSEIELLRETYSDLLETTKGVLSLRPHPAWATFHEKTAPAMEKALRGYLALIDVLLARSIEEACDLMAEVNNRFGEAGRVVEETKVVLAGKGLRCDQTSSVPTAIASLVTEGLDLPALCDLGWQYFGALFRRDTQDIPRENGFILAIWAVIAESFDDPRLLKQRAGAVMDLCRQADKADRTSLKETANCVEEDILHASRLLVNTGLRFAATDFSRLRPEQIFDMGIHAYQRLSEGAFKNLLTILLFCEELTVSKAPDYDKISRKGFTKKVRDLKGSSSPLLAGLGDDLVMYIRHADAHCDFSVKTDKVIVHEREWPSLKMLASHQYTEDEFAELIQRLLEAVFAIFVGIRSFQIKLHEEYLSTDTEVLSDYEKSELIKYFFAAKGIIVHSIQKRDYSSGRPGVEVLARLAEGIHLTPEALLTPMKILSDSFSDADLLIVELCDANNRVMGTLTVPGSHFQKYPGAGRRGELVLLELRYRTLTQYADPRDLFCPNLSKVEVYEKHFLKPTCVYLMRILTDCLEMARIRDEPSLDSLMTLGREIKLLQRMLASNDPPRSHRHLHTTAMRAILVAHQFTRECQLSIRRKGGGETKDLETILRRAAPLSMELLQFLKQTDEQDNATITKS